MKFYRYLFLLITGGIFISCSKTDPMYDNIYHSTYHKTGVIPDGTARVFSLSGELSDTSVINRIANADSAIFSQYAQTLGDARYFMDTVVFTDGQHATMKDNFMPVKCEIRLNGWQFIMNRTDTSTGTTYLNEITHHINYYIGEIKPDIFSEYLVSSTRGAYYFGYRAREKYLIDIAGGKFRAPLLQFRYIPANSNNIGTVYGYQNNILQNDFYRNLNQDDTVLVRSYFITYEK